MSEDKESELLYIKDMAQLMGRSVSAIKNGIWDKADWLPPHFRSGKLVCWRRPTVLKFFEEQEQKAINPPKKRGRPRKTPPVV